MLAAGGLIAIAALVNSFTSSGILQGLSERWRTVTPERVSRGTPAIAALLEFQAWVQALPDSPSTGQAKTAATFATIQTARTFRSYVTNLDGQRLRDRPELLFLARF